MANIIRAHQEAKCGGCGDKVTWNGTLVDRPACPKCNHRPTEEERQAAQDRFDNMMKKARRR
jgi:hypothetical protein